MDKSALTVIRNWNNEVHKESYKSGNFAWYAHGLSEDIKRQLPLLQRENVQTILDVGCGDGGDVIPLCELGYEVTGLDVSCEGLRVIRERAESKNITNLKLEEGNMQFLPFQDNSFDFVYSGFAIGEMLLFPNTTKKDAALAINEIYRVLKHGHFALLQLTEKVAKEYKTKIVIDKTLSKNKWSELLLESGFRIVEITKNNFKDPPHLGATHGYNKPHTHYWLSFLVNKPD